MVLIDPFWLSLFAKMAATAGIVVIASMVAERTGPFLGGMIATLPISAGPAYAFLAMEHGPVFIEKSALASLAVNAVTAIFAVTYAVLAQRKRLLPSLGCAVSVWLGLAWLVTRVEWTLTAAILLNVGSFALCFFARRRWVAEATTKKVFARRRWDIPLRTLGVITLVGSSVLAGRLFGPGVAGMLAMAPIVMTSLAFILQPRVGGAVAASLFASGLTGLIGFSAALIILHAMVMPFGVALSLLTALAVCVGWNASLVLLRR